MTGATPISPNIPVDPDKKADTPAGIVRARRLRRLQAGLGILGIFVGLAALVIDPSWKMGAFFAFQVGTYALFRRLAVPPKPKKWGIVYDESGRKPLVQAVVRIFDKKYNKLLETQITDKNGAYGFLAAKNVYYLTAEKTGYERYTSPDLDLTKTSETYIDQRFGLKRAAAPVPPARA